MILDGGQLVVWNLSRCQDKLGITAGGVPSTRLISTTAPLVGGGDLSADRTLSIPQATAVVDGYLSAADFVSFSAKESVLTFNAPLSRAVNAVSIPAATGAVNGYLSATDFTTFAAKVSSSRTINTTAPITGGGDLSADRTLALDFTTAWTWTNMQVNATGVGFNGSAATGKSSAYTVTNSTPDRTYDANATTLNELAQVVAALISDLKLVGLLG